MADRNVVIDDKELMAALRKLQAHVDNMQPVFEDIGEKLLASTKRRFGTKTSPDGDSWLGNSDVTIANKGRDWALTGQSGLLRDGLFAQASADGLEVVDPMEYAAMQQFGGTKAEFPALWGDIPARPFMGLSDADRNDALDIISGHLDGAF